MSFQNNNANLKPTQKPVNDAKISLIVHQQNKNLIKTEIENVQKINWQREAK